MYTLLKWSEVCGRYWSRHSCWAESGDCERFSQSAPSSPGGTSSSRNSVWKLNYAEVVGCQKMYRRRRRKDWDCSSSRGWKRPLLYLDPADGVQVDWASILSSIHSAYVEIKEEGSRAPQLESNKSEASDHREHSDRIISSEHIKSQPSDPQPLHVIAAVLCRVGLRSNFSGSSGNINQWTYIGAQEIAVLGSH